AGGVTGGLERALGWLPSATRVLVIKDVRIFWRDPAQWSQFVLFFGILAVYLANLGGLDAAQRPSWRRWIALLNAGASMLILATLTTRFTYPLISLEGRRIWLLGLAPLRRRQLVGQKFALSVAITALFALGLTAMAGWRLSLDPIAFAVTALGVAAATIALSALAVGLGGLYPNFEEAHPARIVSGLGGTLNFLLSVAFVVVVGVAQGVALHADALAARFALASAGWVYAGAAAWLLVWTLLATALPLRWGARSLERTEF
ncbi:MAG: hypothetical protein AAF772_02005, partial [Acidobacteriota bacterium]